MLVSLREGKANIHPYIAIYEQGKHAQINKFVIRFMIYSKMPTGYDHVEFFKKHMWPY